MGKATVENRKLLWVTFLIITGILVSYVVQSAPSPILNEISAGYSLEGRDSLLNLCVSVIYPFIIVGSFFGNVINRKKGLVTLYFAALILLAVGMLINFVSTGYTVFLLGRCVFGLGFGMTIPFIGTAIAAWYTGKLKNVMTTVNSMFPFAATLIAFCGMLPLYEGLNSSFKAALGIWGFIPLLAAILWALTVKAGKPNDESAGAHGGEPPTAGMSLLKIKTVKQLAVIFICDFFYYSYLATILPTYLLEISDLSAGAANLWSAAAFPLAGLLGAACGGLGAGRLGRRKSVLVLGQILKLAGITALTLSKTLTPAIIGVSIFGIGNGMWMPAMYSIPTDLPGVSPKQVGTIFALVTAFGFASGFISPIIGGGLTNAIMNGSTLTGQAAHVFGMRQSLLIFNALNLVSVAVALTVRDPKRAQTSAG